MLHKMSVRLIVYLDNILIMAESKQLANQHAQLVLGALENLGFVVNYEKSVMIPSPQMEFLGFLVDSTTMTLALPREKVRKIQQECQKALTVSSLTLRKLMGGAFAVKAFTQHKTQVKVLLLMDNITAVTYVNKMGGTWSPILSSLAFELWSRCLQCQNSIMARHIQGIQNLQADQESCTVVDHSDWKLKPEIFQCIQRLWGPQEIDLFASRLSYQIPRYASWRPDPGAETVDVFTLDWAQLTGYAFPLLH